MDSTSAYPPRPTHKCSSLQRWMLSCMKISQSNWHTYMHLNVCTWMSHCTPVTAWYAGEGFPLFWTILKVLLHNSAVSGFPPTTFVSCTPDVVVSLESGRKFERQLKREVTHLCLLLCQGITVLEWDGSFGNTGVWCSKHRLPHRGTKPSSCIDRAVDLRGWRWCLELSRRNKGYIWHY